MTWHGQDVVLGMPCFRAVALLLVALLCGCGEDDMTRLTAELTTVSRVFQQRYYQGPLSADDLAGIWVLDSDCVPYLVSTAHRQIYTNRSDHVIVLNADGTAVVRGMNDSSSFWPISEAQERAEYELWLNERPAHASEAQKLAKDGLWKSERSAHASVRPRSFYVWDPTGEVVIAGPYREHPQPPRGVVCKTTEKEWRLEWRSWEGRSEAGWIVNFPDLSFLVVGTVSNRFCLWLHAGDRWTLDERAEIFRYSKVSMEDLRAIVDGERLIRDGPYMLSPTNSTPTTSALPTLTPPTAASPLTPGPVASPPPTPTTPPPAP
jgi:hypothetical protein